MWQVPISLWSPVRGEEKKRKKKEKERQMKMKLEEYFKRLRRSVNTGRRAVCAPAETGLIRHHNTYENVSYKMHIMQT